MGARPITGWAYEPGASSPWATSLHPALGAAATSEPPLDRALCDARLRWGASRVATVAACTEWQPRPQLGGIGYAMLGPSAREDALHSAWSLIELDVADAVVCTVDADDWACSVLLERTGSSQLQLRADSVRSADFVFPKVPSEGLRALAVAALVVEQGIPCCGGVEPERVGVVLSGVQWMVEVRT